MAYLRRHFKQRSGLIGNGGSGNLAQSIWLNICTGALLDDVTQRYFVSDCKGRSQIKKVCLT